MAANAWGAKAAPSNIFCIGDPIGLLNPECTLPHRRKALEFARIIHNSENGSDISQMWREKVCARGADSLHCVSMNGFGRWPWGCG